MTMDVRGTTEVVSWVLGFGDKARVAEPAALVAAVAGELERARALLRALLDQLRSPRPGRTLTVHQSSESGAP